MDAKDFGQLLKDHPEMLDDSKKLAAILRDIYPSEKGNVNLIITACNAGVVSMLRKSELDSLLDSRIINLLMDDYAIAEEKARWAAELWTDAYYYFQQGTLREREQPKAASSTEAEKAPSKTESPVAPVTETDPNCFKATASSCAITKYVGPEIRQAVIPTYIKGGVKGYKYKQICSKCGVTFYRSKLPKWLATFSQAGNQCAKCCGKFRYFEIMPNGIEREIIY